MTVYLDCNATTPIDPRVRDLVVRFMDEEFGNAGSRTHEFGLRAKQAVQRAREQVAETVGAGVDEVIFTSGATESNNLAILGLAAHGEATGKKHIVSTAIEHKAVLEPLEELAKRGFQVDLIRPNTGGWVDPPEIRRAVRDDTLLVSVMQVNNETGVIQPLEEIADSLKGHPVFLHSDAAQGFGKVASAALPRIDLLSLSGHKIFAPKGVGALIARRRRFDRVPLKPLAFGGGQERGLRPGTLPVALIAGLGLAAELGMKEGAARVEVCRSLKRTVVETFEALGAQVNGDPDRTVPHTLNASIPGLDSEAVMVALKDIVAISNGSACTSQSYKASHVLEAMALSGERLRGAIRLSWCHMTAPVDWQSVTRQVEALR